MDDQRTPEGIDWNPIATYQKALYGELMTSAGGIILGLASRQYWLSGVSCLALAGGIYMTQIQENIPANPRHIGVMTWWGQRSTARLLPPGDYFIYKKFPLQMDIIKVSMESRPKDFKITCPTRLKQDGVQVGRSPTSGGEVQAHIQIVFVPDTSSSARLFQFIDAGGPLQSGSNPTGALMDALQGRLAEIVRTTLGRLAWNEAQFKKEPLSAVLLMRITGEVIKKYNRDPDGVCLRANGTHTTDPREYCKVGEWTVKEIMEGCEPGEQVQINQVKLELDVATYLTLINDPGNDIADVFGLGIVIKRLNVEEIELLGGLKADAEGAAREQAQRETRRVEMDGRLALAVEMVAKSKELNENPLLTTEGALAILRVEDGKATEAITRYIIQGVDFGELAKSAPAIMGILAAIGRVHPGQANNPRGRRT